MQPLQAGTAKLLQQEQICQRGPIGPRLAWAYVSAPGLCWACTCALLWARAIGGEVKGGEREREEMFTRQLDGVRWPESKASGQQLDGQDDQSVVQ
jgi:hypothetical protein